MLSPPSSLMLYLLYTSMINGHTTDQIQTWSHTNVEPE